MSVITNEAQIDEVLTRGIVEVIECEHLKKRMLQGERLRVKLGIDPTSPNLHIGRSIPILKLRDFQELGHQIILIVGDFTSVIGDTSDKESERPMLDRATIEENKKYYYEQIARMLDINSVEFRYNSEWLEGLTYREIGEHADCFSVADFIARDNIKRRLENGTRVSLREILYPLMQGYDSVAVDADVELGGTDQRFNLLAGRTLQPYFNQEPQDILMTPLINGTDGRKMSSSWGNTINLMADPEDMYGKVMRMADSEIVTYFTVCTRVPKTTITEIETALESGENPRDIKMHLAREIVGLYYNSDIAQAAENRFVATFQKHEIPKDIPEVYPPYEEGIIAADLVTSKSELRRLLEAGAVRDAQSNEVLSELPNKDNAPHILKIGKRRFARLL